MSRNQSAKCLLRGKHPVLYSKWINGEPLAIWNFQIPWFNAKGFWMTLRDFCYNYGLLQLLPPLVQRKTSSTLFGSQKAWIEVSGEPSLELLDGVMPVTIWLQREKPSPRTVFFSRTRPRRKSFRKICRSKSQGSCVTPGKDWFSNQPSISKVFIRSSLRCTVHGQRRIFRQRDYSWIQCWIYIQSWKGWKGCIEWRTY